MNIKICGMKYAGNIRAIAALRPDMMGFIFYAASPRYAGRIDQMKAFREIPETIQKVGVFVNAPLDTVTRTAMRCRLTGIQLHGAESPEYCHVLRSLGYTLIKTIAIGETLDTGLISGYTGCVDSLLLDTAGPAYGGSGQSFDWSLLRDYSIDIPFILSGGLGMESLPALQNIQSQYRQCIGIDANSRLEIRPGFKNVNLTQQFIHTIRYA